jgi:hypothetical protein
MENRIMKKLAFFGLLLVLSLTLSAQRSGHGGGSHSGGSQMHSGGGGHSAGTARFVSGSPGYTPGYSSYGPATYGFGLPSTYTTNPYPDSGNGGPMVIVSPALVPDAGPTVVYIPSYMRPDNGPSLGEIAAQRKTEKQSAKYIWSNVEPLLQPK